MWLPVKSNIYVIPNLERGVSFTFNGCNKEFDQLYDRRQEIPPPDPK